jgi:hypothetical protein
MKPALSLIALVLTFSTTFAGPSTSSKREKAMKEVGACLRRGRVPSRECKNIDKNAKELVDAYWQGDKSVLPLLLRVRFYVTLGDFYSAVLIADSDTFLTDLSLLPEKDQREIALNIAGGDWGVTPTRFDAIRSTLRNVPQSSPNYQLARLCLLTLKRENAALLINFFPPQTFSGPSGKLMAHWFSRDLHLLREEPLWPPASASTRIYRITILPAFFAPESATLTTLPDGRGRITFNTLVSKTNPQLSTDARSISSQQVADFTSTLNRAQFWQSPTEVQSRGMGIDGAEYIFEGVHDGEYHVVLRWCPGVRREKPFTDMANQLFRLSSHPLKVGC